MKIHELKIKSEYMAEIWLHRKTFELRKNDRDFEVGDIVHFNIIEKTRKEPYPDDGLYRITYVLKDVPEYGLQEGYCIFGIRKLVQETFKSSDHLWEG